MEVFKILKLRAPISIHNQFNISQRKDTLIITASPKENFVSRSAILWNAITPKMKLTDFSCKIGTMKNSLKKSLLAVQHAENSASWTQEDFNMQKIWITLFLSIYVCRPPLIFAMVCRLGVDRWPQGFRYHDSQVSWSLEFGAIGWLRIGKL